MSIKSSLWQVHIFSEWVKEVMIKMLVQEGDGLCQYNCGDGIDIGKIQRSNIDRYIGVDKDSRNVEKAQKRLLEKDCSFKGSFVVGNIFKQSVPLDEEYNHVVCFNGLDKELSSISRFEKLFRSVSAVLLEGGLFFGTFMDSEVLWTGVQKSILKKQPLNIQTPVSLIEFRSGDIKQVGTEYTVHMDNVKTPQYLIHIPTLIQVAKAHGFEALGFTNFNQFYDVYKNPFGSLLQRNSGLKTKFSLHPIQKQVIGYYTTFLFQKIKDLT